jgi:hypothetical protein
MLLLDENLPADQRHLLRKWRLHFRVIGVDVAATGATDENLLSVFHRLPDPTFFTLDRNFFRLDWSHARYLVWLDVSRRDAAALIRRFLQHEEFGTNARRRGVVARVHVGGVQFWRMGRRGRQKVGW